MMMVKIAIAVAVILTMIVIYAAVTPPAFLLTREITINAPAAVIFEHLNNPRKFDVWNPWTKSDPNLKMIYEGPVEGMGASCIWNGNSQVGEGKMTIIESTPTSLVKSRLDYIRPFPSTAEAVFTLKPDGAQTVVAWSISGDRPFVPRLMNVVLNIDKMIRDTFDKGLGKLKEISEAQAAKN
ncbi:MAG: SRPBCC family protein [Bdellovibrionales bacterium]